MGLRGDGSKRIETKGFCFAKSLYIFVYKEHFMSDIQSITQLGNPGNPTGQYGKLMLADMNEHHLPVTTWGLSHWTVNPNDTILDIGCGGGRTIHTLSQNVTSGKVYGVDYSETALECAAEYNAAEIAANKVKVINASVECLPFSDQTFDKIVTVESFYFWPSPVDNLREVRRVLKIGGTFLLIADIHGDADLTEHEMENIARYNLFNPTKAEFEELFKQAGFSEITIHTKDGTNWICVEGKR